MVLIATNDNTIAVYNHATTWESVSQGFLGQPLQFRLSHSFANNLNGGLSSFILITLEYHFSLHKSLLFLKVFKPKSAFTSSSQVVMDQLKLYLHARNYMDSNALIGLTFINIRNLIATFQTRLQ